MGLVDLKKHLIMLWAFLAVSLIKLCLGQYSVGPAIYQGYNRPRSVHISGHMGPVRTIPVAAGSYQSHIPYHVVNHAPVYHVEPAPVAVHPMPVATYHADAPAVIPVHDEPVPHHVEPVIHPDDVEDFVEETHSHQREYRNFALADDLVPYEFKVPVLSMSMRKPSVSKRKGRNENPRNNENEERNPRNNENERNPWNNENERKPRNNENERNPRNNENERNPRNNENEERNPRNNENEERNPRNNENE